jgi:hypothetical protein
MSYAYVEGKMVKVGDDVSFKSDIEQSGRIYKIEGDKLYLENPYGFEGDYIGGDTTTVVRARDCWID